MEIKKLLNRKQVAEMLGVSVHTLAVWACTKRYDLPFVKVGRLAKYNPDDVAAYIARNTVGTASA